jgi:predicted negative regulator of RcsB-dependent stress response
VDEHLTDEQQAEVVKKWLRENGGYIIGGLALGLGGLFGLNQWESFKQGSAEQASALYDNVVGAIMAERPSSADQYIMTLEEKHANSPYLDQARLMMAKSHLDRSEFEVAASYLAQVVADSESEEIVHIARLRLARVRLHQQQYDAALEILNAADGESAFTARYHEVRGDVYLAMNRSEEARSEYALALGDVGPNVAVDRVYLQSKLDALGGEAPSAIDDSFPESDFASDDSAFSDSAATE